MMNQPPAPVFMRLFLKGWHSSPRRGTWQTPSVGEAPRGSGGCSGGDPGEWGEAVGGASGALGWAGVCGSVGSRGTLARQACRGRSEVTLSRDAGGRVQLAGWVSSLHPVSSTVQGSAQGFRQVLRWPLGARGDGEGSSVCGGPRPAAPEGPVARPSGRGRPWPGCKQVSGVSCRATIRLLPAPAANQLSLGSLPPAPSCSPWPWGRSGAGVHSKGLSHQALRPLAVQPAVILAEEPRTSAAK